MKAWCVLPRPTVPAGLRSVDAERTLSQALAGRLAVGEESDAESNS